MTRPARRARLVLALLGTLAAGSAHGQEVGFYLTSASSALPELAAAQGGGAFLLLVAPGFNVRGTVYSQSSTRSLSGRVCASVNPPSNCTQAEFTRTTRLRGFGVAGALPVLRTRQLGVEVGGGPSFNIIEAVDAAPPQRRTALFTQETGNIGMLLSGTVRAQPVRGLPIVLHALAGSHTIWMTACGEYVWMDDPYCGRVRMAEFRLGLGYQLGR
jgi:hypothetical protein